MPGTLKVSRLSARPYLTGGAASANVTTPGPRYFSHAIVRRDRRPPPLVTAAVSVAGRGSTIVCSVPRLNTGATFFLSFFVSILRIGVDLQVTSTYLALVLGVLRT